MKRLVLFVLCGGLVVTTLGSSASASQSQAWTRHKICIEFPSGTTGTPDGFCIVQSLPL
ncbi:MAG: hypothetical protein JWM02_175 [Frankiales bacterium]|nr:hypothetical protein [Frankiales bacterium]